MDKKKEPRSMKELAQEALDVQNACNLSGVVFGFARAMEDICAHDQRLGKGTDWKNNHPIVKMWIWKCADLARMVFDMEDGKLDAANLRVDKIAKGEDNGE